MILIYLKKMKYKNRIVFTVYLIPILLMGQFNDKYRGFGIDIGSSGSGVFVTFSSLILKKNVFYDAEYFYQGYYLIAAINPLLSTLILVVIINFLMWDILVMKFLADLATSLFSFYLLRKL